ncbi:hypothetical protein HWV62_19321 [Athelia sp. TMB]|nr:hypothetical protein HWV62_19321 [Athelia sp. TMB]
MAKISINSPGRQQKKSPTIQIMHPFNFNPSTPTPSTPYQFDSPSLPSSTESPNSFTTSPTRCLIEPVVIDKLARDFKLEAPFDANLHAFVKLGEMDGTLSKSDLATRLYTLAAFYCEISERKCASRDQDITDLKGIFADLKIRLETTFELTKDQKTNVRRIANDLIYQPQRTVFRTLNIDVMKYAQEHAEVLRLSNVFGNPAREQTLASHMKRVASSVRNALRQEIRDSLVNPKTKCTLAHFTYRAAVKFRRGQFEESMGIEYTIHNAILRRFGLDNLDLLNRTEAVEGAVEGDEGDGDVEDSDSGSQPKRKRTKVGRVPHGEDFWGKVDSYFVGMVGKLGRNLAGAGWKDTVNEMIRRGNAIFDSAEASTNSSGPNEPVAAQGAGAFGLM